MINMKKKYAIVGTGSRSKMYFSALLDTHSDVGELVALCDINPVRMNYYNKMAKEVFGCGQPLPVYRAEAFERMIEETKPDTVIVTTIDCTHHQYIIKAMELGCDVITEKPMTTDAEKCQQIIDAVERTRRDLRVAFNYRYSPRNSKIKEVLESGEIGDILSVHFEWLLDTRHGADYFRRWHREKEKSGGLMVHKSTHHFDLVNWWMGAKPEQVYAMGKLGFYGRENGKKRGIQEFPERYQGWPGAAWDPFSINIADNPAQKGLYLDAEKEDGYFRDQNVFGDGITIEDTASVMVRYDNDAFLTYSLNAHCPWEGYRVMFNGSKGRIEIEVVERSYVAGAKTDHNLAGQHALATDPSLGEHEKKEHDVRGNRPMILLQRHWETVQEIPCEVQRGGGHGGGDVRLLDDLFRDGGSDDPLGRAANFIDGARSILVGVAANQCFQTGQPVQISELVKLPVESRPSMAGV